MNTDRLTAVAPHYAAMVLLSIVALSVARLVVGDLGFWIQLVVVFVVVFAYRPVVALLGLEPTVWTRE
jgi:hypothetical protein